MDKKKDNITNNVDNKQAPFIPIKRPRPIQEKKLKNGNKSKQRYIGYCTIINKQ
jgi:hypothetical protein